MCVINENVTTQYFELKIGARKGGPISAYLFILCWEILFMIVKDNEVIKRLKTPEIPSYIQLMQMTRLFS